MSTAGFAPSKLQNSFVMHMNGDYETRGPKSLSLPVSLRMFESRFPKQKGAGITPSHHTSPAPLSHYWIRRDGFTSWADPIGLVTFPFPQEPDGSLCVTANASQLASRVKDIVLIWG